LETLRTFLEVQHWGPALNDAFEAVMGTWRVSSQFFLMKVLCLSFDTFQFFRCRQPYLCYLSSDPCLKFWFLHPKFCQFLPSNQHLDHRNLGITKFWKFKRNFLQIWICELTSAENFQLKETQKKLPTMKKKDDLVN